MDGTYEEHLEILNSEDTIINNTIPNIEGSVSCSSSSDHQPKKEIKPKRRRPSVRFVDLIIKKKLSLGDKVHYRKKNKTELGAGIVRLRGIVLLLWNCLQHVKVSGVHSVEGEWKSEPLCTHPYLPRKWKFIRELAVGNLTRPQSLENFSQKHDICELMKLYAIECCMYAEIFSVM
ncbi:hypothetical protein ACLOJK_003425 [Asimina triloba]